MRNRTPPSFTVETKSGGRHPRTFIPHRAVAPVVPRPAVSWPPPAEPKALRAEPRRILPSLIAPEPLQVEPELAQVQPEPMQVSAVRSPKPRRGRPPKAKPIAVKVVDEQIAGPAIQIAPAQLASPPAPRTLIAPLARIVKPSTTLPLGERWKRRLGRWSL